MMATTTAATMKAAADKMQLDFEDIKDLFEAGAFWLVVGHFWDDIRRFGNDAWDWINSLTRNGSRFWHHNLTAMLYERNRASLRLAPWMLAASLLFYAMLIGVDRDQGAAASVWDGIIPMTAVLVFAVFWFGVRFLVQHDAAVRRYPFEIDFEEMHHDRVNELLHGMRRRSGMTRAESDELNLRAANDQAEREQESLIARRIGPVGHSPVRQALIYIIIYRVTGIIIALMATFYFSVHHGVFHASFNPVVRLMVMLTAAPAAVSWYIADGSETLCRKIIEKVEDVLLTLEGVIQTVTEAVGVAGLPGTRADFRRMVPILRSDLAVFKDWVRRFHLNVSLARIVLVVTFILVPLPLALLAALVMLYLFSMLELMVEHERARVGLTFDAVTSKGLNVFHKAATWICVGIYVIGLLGCWIYADPAVQQGGQDLGVEASELRWQLAGYGLSYDKSYLWLAGATLFVTVVSLFLGRHWLNDKVKDTWFKWLLMAMGVVVILILLSGFDIRSSEARAAVQTVNAPASPPTNNVVADTPAQQPRPARQHPTPRGPAGACDPSACQADQACVRESYRRCFAPLRRNHNWCNELDGRAYAANQISSQRYPGFRLPCPE